MPTTDRVEIRPAQGDTRIKLIGECRDLLQAPEFTGQQFTQFTDKMIALVGGEQESPTRWSHFIVPKRGDKGLAFYRYEEGTDNATWIEIVSNREDIRLADLKTPVVSEVLSPEVVGREDDPEITTERYLTGFNICLPKGYDRSGVGRIIRHRGYAHPDDFEIDLLDSSQSLSGLDQRLVDNKSYVVSSQRVRELCEHSLNAYLPEVRSTLQIYIDEHMAFYRRPH